MLRITENSNPDGAKSYYRTADYYSEGQELSGTWHGRGAKLLGLAGEIRKQDWNALCDNRNPATGQRLTVRQKANRRIGYDFTFDVPKSVSLLFGLTGDERILNAFQESVAETMEAMEREMKARVRSGKGLAADTDRVTGNMIWGEYVHTTARPVQGLPDPHLHAHCFVFNATHDPVERRWKAGQFAGLKRDAPYFEAMCHAKLAYRLAERGIPIRRTPKAWEIDGVPEATLTRFSRRTSLIETAAARKDITDPKAKAELGMITRERKSQRHTSSQLRQQWDSMLSDSERRTLAELAAAVGQPRPHNARVTPGQAVTWAADHLFERKSVVAERDLLTASMRHGYGDVDPDTLPSRVEREGLIAKERDGCTWLTSPEVLREEAAMLDVARRGRGASTPFHTSSNPIRFQCDKLNMGQRQAVRHVLTSPDRIMLIRGPAGTGKTTMMREAIEGIESSGKRVFTFAPSSDASRGTLRKEGFDNAETVSMLLASSRMQEAVRGQVLWIDEAGLLGTKTMRSLFELAERQDARIVLSGDRRQHASVERGAALRLLETEAGLVPAELREIKRQSGEYKKIVGLLGDGRIAEGFRGLDRMGWIHEVQGEDRSRVMARDYAAAQARLGKTNEHVLAISPTHREADQITQAIRKELASQGMLGATPRSFTTLHDAGLTAAERSDPVHYHPGDVLVFHQNAKGGHTRGERLPVRADSMRTLPYGEARHFQLYRAGRIDLVEGDTIRITRNGKSAQGAALHNGELYTVKGFTHHGDLLTTAGKVIPKNYGHLDYGYVITSHASQGKTVAEVLIAQSSTSFPASSREQFYVSVSRGVKRAALYTDDRNGLLDAVKRSDPRLSATELIRGRAHLAPQQTQMVVPTLQRKRELEYG